MKITGLATGTGYKMLGNDNRQVAMLMLAHDGTIEWISVNPEHQGKGYATALLRHAEAQGWQVKHSPHRSDEGERWARRVGGIIPPRCRRKGCVICG